MNFAAGDVVQLKSGGPRMTVEAVSDGTVSCIWFEQSHQLRDEFPEILLMPAARSSVTFGSISRA
jgi:uncharacterized protein YodC (DUF2158 family)|tara:strand:+ start:2646 stop:2840 length:195 start_codon:yes stop_codon:yes gene_type:complete